MSYPHSVTAGTCGQPANHPIPDGRTDDVHAFPLYRKPLNKARYGPVAAVYRAIADDPDKVAALDQDLTDLAVRFTRTTATGTQLDWEYLLLTAHKR